MHLFKKVLLTGILAVSPIIAAGAAYASPSYTVAPNDTMYKIAVWNGVSLNALIQANPQVANPNVIWTGMTLNIPASAPAAKPAAASVSSAAMQVASLVNQERANAGLSPLTVSGSLSVMALDKAKDMYSNGYFDHTSPNYGSPFDMMQAYGISYSYAGENIAKGQQSAQQVMTDWMNSPGHRANILNSHYTKIGVAYYNGEWVQEFTG